MPDYQQGKIYTIRCRIDETLIYVGSTTQSLAVRWGGHKRDSIKKKISLIYRTINNDWDNWFIELYELYPCSCKEELCRKEGEIIRLIGTLNVKIEGRTQKEWRENHADKKKEYDNNHADKIKEYQKEYRENKAEKKKEYQKEYKKNNADEIRKYKKEYYLKKKAEKLNSTHIT